MRIDRGDMLLMAFCRHRPLRAVVMWFFFFFGVFTVVADVFGLLGVELKPHFLRYTAALSFTMPTLVGWMRGTLRKGRFARPNVVATTAPPEPLPASPTSP